MPMRLDEVGLIAVESSRTRAYLCALEREGLLPSQVIFLAPQGRPPARPLRPVPYFDNTTPALDVVSRLGLPCQVLNTLDINSAEVQAALRDEARKVWIYSGPGGAIVKRETLRLGRFLHIHPGLVPRFRGSTTVYYSLLLEGRCGASAIFLDERIDEGPLLALRGYPPPSDRSTIDDGYDPHIRADLLVRVLRQFERTGRWKHRTQEAGPAETYYIMHPVLRHIAILSKRGDTP